MAAPIHTHFRSSSLSSSLDEEKKRPFHRVREVDYSEKQLPDIPQKQPKCYQPVAIRVPFLALIAIWALAVFILVECFAHQYTSYGSVKHIPAPWPKGLTPADFGFTNSGSSQSVDGDPLAPGDTSIKKRDDGNVGVFGIPSVTASDPKGFDPALGMLSVFRSSLAGHQRAVFQSKYFRQQGQRGLSAHLKEKREHTLAKRQDGANDTSKGSTSTGNVTESNSVAGDAASPEQPFAGPGPTFTPDDIYADWGKYTLAKSQYFVASYLLLILSFGVRVLWTCSYNSVRLMEPFYALSSATGATAEHALNAMYLHDSLLPEPIRALRGRQWLMFFAGLGSLSVAFLPAFALGVLRPDDVHCPVALVPDLLHPCPQTMYVRTWTLRLVETLLLLIIVIAAGIAITNLYRSSGVYSDPSAIATLTSLLHHPTMVERLCRVDDSTDDDELEEIFNGDRYRIAGYRTLDMTTRYGIVPVGKTGWVSRSATDDSISSLDKSKARLAARKLADRPQRKTWRKVFRKMYTEIGLALLLLTLLALNVAYYLDLKPDPFNLFFNSSNMAPRFIFTIMGALVASAWRRIECQNRTQAPYQHLRKPGAATALLTPTCSSSWTSFFYAAVRRQPFVVLSAFCTMLSEILVIALSGVPFSALQYYAANMAHVWLSIAILSFMILALGVHIFHRLRHQSFMPREPDTLLGAWSYIAASEMREDFECLALQDTETRARRVQSWGKQYQFAEQICVDGVQRLALDEVTSKGSVYHA